MADVPGLAIALAAVAPRADPAIWLPALAGAMYQAGITTPRRVAAFLGQCAHESGKFTVLAEDTLYRTPQRLLDLFPSRVHSLRQAQGLVGNAEAIANCVYAGRQGNGDEASGDGWRFRGGGLLQLTGRTEYEPFAASVGMTPEAAADYVRTPKGAAVSACWYWTKHGLNALADTWALPSITRAINGTAMLGAAERSRLSEAALNAIFEASATAAAPVPVPAAPVVTNAPPASPATQPGRPVDRGEGGSNA